MAKIGQNAQFGSKIKILKKVGKATLEAHYSCSVQKNAFKKHQIFEK